MIRKTEDFEILKSKDVYLYFDTVDMCERLYPILKSKGYNIIGLIKSDELFEIYKKDYNKREGNFIAFYGELEAAPDSLFGIHIIDISEYRGEGTVVVGTLEENRRKYVSKLINNNYTNFIMLHASYVELLLGSAAKGVIKYFRDTNYMACGYEETEVNHVIGSKKPNPKDFKFRMDGGWWFLETMKHNKINLKSDDLQKEYENSWGKYSEVDRLKATDETDQKFKDNCTIYSIRSHFDHIDPTNKIPSYLTPLQAGAALTDKVLCECRDNIGEDNISDRNADFSECSAIYWAWKNGEQNKKYVGVCHYRRFMAASTADFVEQFDKGVDVVNVIPTLMYPTIYDFFNQGFLYTKDFELIDEAIDKLFPEYKDANEELKSSHWYLANNIFVMKKEWFDKMCEFVFGTILYVDDYYRAHGLIRGDRYAGYIFEYLYSVFVKKHALEMKIVYTNMSFLLNPDDLKGAYAATKASTIGLKQINKAKKGRLKRAYECVADNGISYSIIYLLRKAVKFVVRGFKFETEPEEDQGGDSTDDFFSY